MFKVELILTPLYTLGWVQGPLIRILLKALGSSEPALIILVDSEHFSNIQLIDLV